MRPHGPVALLLLVTFALGLSLHASGQNDGPLLAVLTETGEERDGLPVLAGHPEGERIARELNRGLTREMLELYRFLQYRLKAKRGTPVEPAWLLLSSKQGGFARFGFWHGEVKKSGVAYVDVHRDWELSGRLGAIDQIFPHELSHAILRQMAGKPPSKGGANQIHAIAVRTDRAVAFDEGLAEHFQLMAVEHPEADPATRAAAEGDDAAMERQLDRYRRELAARLAPATRMRISFPLWYSNAERRLRYGAVRRNAFARETAIPERLLTTRDRYPAYLIENAFPGDPRGPVKPVGRLLATEGVVSSFFYRWATSPALRQSRRPERFYSQFGTTGDAVTPLQNVYLKIFHAVEQHRPHDTASFIRAYRATFPDEAPLADAVASEIFPVQSPDAAPAEIWLANAGFPVGTTIFDQYRGVPRTHTFDLNSASIVDLTSVEGVAPELARAIIAGAPYDSVEDLRRIAGLPESLLSTMKAMEAEMEKLAADVDATSLSLRPIFLPYLWRILAVLLLAGSAGAAVYRMAASCAGIRIGTFRALTGGLGGAAIALAASWIFGNPAAAVGAVALLFALPAALWQLWRLRSFTPPLLTLARWMMAALPAAVMTIPVG